MPVCVGPITIPLAMPGTSSRGRRSAKDVRELHQTPGEHVWTATKSTQLKAMLMLASPDFVLQDDPQLCARFFHVCDLE